MLGLLFVVTGPSGAGKDSVIEKARELQLDFGMITTTTTRAMRPGEAEGNPYYFLQREEFERRVQGGEFVEWAEVYGNLYGATKIEVERVRKQHAVVIVRVDPRGARAYKKMIPETITLFIQPPSFEFLEKHLVDRATDSSEVIQQRLEVAKTELQNLHQWDYLIMNEEGKLHESAQALISIVKQMSTKTFSVHK